MSSSSFAERVKVGLTSKPKKLPPVLFYDARGSDLFDQICELDEYYLTRTERALIEGSLKSLLSHCAKELTVAELGSGSSEKTTLILDALVRSERSVRYVTIDVSEPALTAAAERLRARHAKLDLVPLVAEYEPGLERLPEIAVGQRLLTFLGSSLGNYEPEDMNALLANMRRAVRPGDLMLLGLDLVKDRVTLERAYDDEKGVTAEFNRNMLVRINRELGGEFRLEHFRHWAPWNEKHSRIEMHLQSKVEHTVKIAGLDLEIHFDKGETIHTESSYKYAPEEIAKLGKRAGFGLIEQYFDPQRWFSLSLFRAEEE